MTQTELAGYATEMGAVHKYDLTPDVTHLIVGDYNTPKYRFVAKERPDVEPMTVAWIEAVRELWINDQEVDFEELQRVHKLPTFHSLKFSMTGCDDRKATKSCTLEVANRTISCRKTRNCRASQSWWGSV